MVLALKLISAGVSYQDGLRKPEVYGKQWHLSVFPMHSNIASAFECELTAAQSCLLFGRGMPCSLSPMSYSRRN